jgi:signal transduction histidine kinase
VSDTQLVPEERAIPRAHREGFSIIAACVLLACAIFVLDIGLRLGMAVPVLYTGIVWLAANSNDKRLTLISAVVCSVLTVCGLFFSPPGKALLTTIVSNRLLYLFVIWMTTVLLFQRRDQEKQLEQYSEVLEEKVEQRTVQLRKAHIRALQAERLAAIGQMVTGLAHESKNALQRIQSSINRLYRRVRGQEELIRIVGDIEKASDDVGRLYEEVKSYAAPIVLDKANHNLKPIWEKSWKDLEPLRAKRNVNFVEEVKVSSLQCSVDSFRIGQVFRNVFENSLSACSDPVQLEISCSASTLDGNPALKIAIADNGPGFTQEQVDNIFSPFFTTKTKGTGLGMAIAMRIIEAHDGIIWANPKNNSGAEIVIVLPVF